MKDTYVRVRLTTMEKQIFEKKAEDFNMTVSDYIKYCCLINPPKPNQYEREVEYKADKK